MPMWNRLHRFNALPQEARLLFLRAVVLLPLTSVSLKVWGFRATQKSLQRRASSGASRISANASADQKIDWCVRMVNAAARELWPASTCLERSLVLWQLLRRLGVETTVRIGARKVEGDFEAHAWVERNGVQLNDRAAADHSYATFEAAFPMEPEIS